MMRWLLALFCLLPTLGQAQNERAPEVPELKVEAIVAGGDGTQIFVQQQLLLKITLTSRHPFKTLQIESPAIENAQAHVASRARTREFSTYGGSGWRHQRITALFPLRSGLWILPQITATGSVVLPDGTVRGFESRSAQSRIEVQPAHPYLNGFWWVAAEDISLTEEWSKDLSTLKIGDTVRRTIRMTATGTTAERLPALEMTTTPGISVHKAGENHTTRFTPDGAIAEVIGLWDITVNSEDPVNIAPVSVTWWHTGEVRPASSGVPAGRIEPLAVDGKLLRAELLAEAASEQESKTFVLLALMIFVSAPLVLFGLAVLSALLPTAADLRLWLRLRSRSDSGLVRAVIQWGRRSVDPQIRTVGHVTMLAPTDVAEILHAIQRSVYGQEQLHRTDHWKLMRWSRKLRLQRLRSGLGRLIDWVIGSTASG